MYYYRLFSQILKDLQLRDVLQLRVVMARGGGGGEGLNTENFRIGFYGEGY